MEAIQRCCFAATLFVSSLVIATSSLEAANARTQNFLVHAPSQALADAVANGAEQYRDQLATYWLGKRLPPWRTPCPIEVVAGPNLAAQGVTQYDRNTGRNFQMKVIGSPERIMDSVLPHEVTHTVLATHFGGPLPRWADEGICTTVEHEAERRKHEIMLREFLKTRRGIAMNRLFLLTEYPAEMLPMYAQGYSVCRFLIQQSGPRQFIQFLTDYMEHPSWTRNVRKHYGYDSLAQLQERWLAWVAEGSGPVEKFVSSGRRSATSPVDGPTQAVGSLVAQASSTLPTNRTSVTTGTGTKGSWYLRRRDEASGAPQTATDQILAMGGAENVPAGIAQQDSAPASSGTTLPPSVAASGRYSVSQPQAGQRFGHTARVYR